MRNDGNPDRAIITYIPDSFTHLPSMAPLILLLKLDNDSIDCRYLFYYLLDCKTNLWSSSIAECIQ